MQVFSNSYNGISSSYNHSESKPIEYSGTNSSEYILRILDFLDFPVQELGYIYYFRFDYPKSMTILLYQKKNLINGIIIAIHSDQIDENEDEDEIDRKYNTSIKILNKYEGKDRRQGWNKLSQEIKNDILKQNGYN